MKREKNEDWRNVADETRNVIQYDILRSPDSVSKLGKNVAVVTSIY